MGLFDRLFSPGSGSSKPATGPQARKAAETRFLDADESSSLGDVNFMRRSNTIRRTFPGTADSPGDKEMVAEVASMEARLEKATQGLPGTEVPDEAMTLTDGIPKPVKKTFAQPMSQAELDQRKRGSALGVNVPGVAASAAKDKEQAASTAAASTSSSLNTAKPGAIDPFKQMVKDLNS